MLVYHDLLGMMQHPHHAKVTPKFCKQYGSVGAAIQTALSAYNEEVKGGAFPSQQHTPYRISGGQPERPLAAYPSSAHLKSTCV